MEIKYEIFEKWLDEILSNDMPEEVEAVNFNLYEQGNDSWSIELIAAASFEENDEDWACDEVFDTRDMPFDISYDGNWEEVLELFSGFVCDYLKKGSYAEKLKKFKAVAIGFVDGDINVLYQR